MGKKAVGFSIGAVRLDANTDEPLARQLFAQVRDAILHSQLHPGDRLPSTRAMAEELGVSRTTIVAAFEQLIAEGYLEGQVGSGTRVMHALPEELLRARDSKCACSCASPSARTTSRRGRDIATMQPCCPPPAQRSGSFAFRPGLPDINEFPFETWASILARSWRSASRHFLASRETDIDYPSLQDAIARYLGRARGVCCRPQQVIIVSGSQQALDLAARVLIDAGDKVWIEDPGYVGGRNALLAAGAKLVPVPVDAEGLDVARGIRRSRKAKLAYVTPSHQYPLGVTMSLARRLELLEWAKASGAWIVEDDYDSEYRYAGWAPAPLQCLDASCRTIYIGTFSKVLLPSIRVGYLVIPEDLIDVFKAARTIVDRRPNVEQIALAEFISEGHFARHVRRMRGLYQRRQQVLITALREELADKLEVMANDGGLHLVGWLRDGVDDQLASAAAAAEQVEAPALSACALEPLPRGGLLLGFGAVGERDIKAAVARVKRALSRGLYAKRARTALINIQPAT